MELDDTENCPLNCNSESEINIRDISTITDSNLTNKEAVYDFLSFSDLKKDNINRFIAWMLSFRIFSYNKKKWIDTIDQIFNEYQIIIKENLLDDVDNPLQTLTQDNRSVISADISQNIPWFKEMAAFLNIQEESTERVEYHAHRITALLIHTKQLIYAQEHDNYFFIAYLLSLYFTEHAHLSLDHAEALTYHLTYALINISGISTYLNNPVSKEKHFSRIDEIIEETSPNKYNFVKEMENGSESFALQWELNTFSDKYNIEELFYLWDNIILKKRYYEEFMACLSAAHFIQLPILQENEQITDLIQNYKSFSVVRAVDDAIKLMGSEKGQYSLKAIGISICVLVLCLFTTKYIL